LLPISARFSPIPTLITTASASFSGVKAKPDVGTIGFEFITESSHPFYVGRWGVRMQAYSHDIAAGTYIDIQIPDSHAYEFKQEIGAAQVYAPTEAQYLPTQCTVNGVIATELMLPTYTPYSDPMSAMVAYKLALKGPVPKALISPLAATPGNGGTYEHGQRLRLRVPQNIRKVDFINSDFKTMDVNVLCSSVRNPNVTSSAGLLQFTMYSQQFKAACDIANESVFSGCASAGGTVAPLVPVKTVFVPPIHTAQWGSDSLSFFAAANNTAGSDYSTVTLQIQSHILPVSTRGVIDFRLPSSWLVQSIPVGHARAGIIWTQ
jgi:hypothetical protein